MKKQIAFLTFLFTLFSLSLSAQTVNTTTQISWPLNLGTADQVATFSLNTGQYFSQNWLDKGSNMTFKDANTAMTVTYTRFQPIVQNNSVTENDFVSFNIRPKTGLKFTPTSLTFDCQRFGTGGGLIDVKWKAGNGNITTIATALKPARDQADGTTHASYDLSGLSIPTENGDCSLLVYIYSLGNNKQVGLGSIVLNGTILGTIIDIPTYTLSTSVSPVNAGDITTQPVGKIFDEGTDVTLSATRKFGFIFSHWANENDQQLSTQNPYTVKMTANTTVKAVFTPINTYELKFNVQGGAKDYMISVTPAPTIIETKKMYEENTNVTLTANNNQLMTFNNWGSGETNAQLLVNMNGNKEITAVYSSVDYAAGWDFYFAGGNSRTADFYSNADNQVSSLILRNAEGTVSGWLDKSQMAAGGYEGKPAAVNWRPLTDKYYYQASFNATDFTDISVSSSMLLNYNAYSIQRIEYSIDGTNFTKLDSIELTTAKVWYPKTVTLPADANHVAKVYVRWIPNYNSASVGTTSANDGTSIAEIFVFGKTAFVNDGVAPVLVSSVPAPNGTGASATGKVVLTFDEKVQVDAQAAALLNGKYIKPTVSGKTLTFAYTGLEYNTEYTFDFGENNVSDLGGNKLTSKINFKFTTMNRPVVTKKAFDFVVGVNGDFKAALTAAQTATASGNRYYIFFPDGEYNIGANTGDTNQKTTIATANISYVGQSSDGVILYNKNTIEGIGSTATLNFTSTANNIYMQDITLRNKDFRNGTSLGRCVVLQDQGTKNIYKNVKLQSNQDTYYSGSGRLYFENCALHGTVDYLCGGGDVFFNECLLYLEERGGNVITAPATSSNWGYVFSGCTIDGFEINNNSYRLGRPWQNAPRSIYINTRMNILPAADGWTEMGVVPGLFAEYNSVTSTGAIVDLSMRKKSFTYNGVTTPVNPYLTAEQAATYTIENVLGGTDAWQPKLYTDQVAAPVISLTGNVINWADNNYVLCWAIFKDGKFAQFTTTNSYSIPILAGAGGMSATYTVRAANEMGGLGAASNAVTFAIDGVTTPVTDAQIVNKSYYSIEGKQVFTPENHCGILIEKVKYSDGSVITNKIMKTDF